MPNREKIEEIFSELRNFADNDVHPVVSPENWHVYSKLRDLIDQAEEDVLALLKEQEAKTGHWTISEYDYLDCSHCGNSYYTGCDSTEEAKMRLKKGFYFKYCPYCGAKMEGR